MTSNRDTNGLKLKNDDLVDGDDEQDLIGVEDGEGDLVGGDDPEVVEGTSGRLLPGNLLVFTSTIANSNLARQSFWLRLCVLKIIYMLSTSLQKYDRAIYNEHFALVAHVLSKRNSSTVS